MLILNNLEGCQETGKWVLGSNSASNTRVRERIKGLFVFAPRARIGEIRRNALHLQKLGPSHREPFGGADGQVKMGTAYGKSIDVTLFRVSGSSKRCI